MYNILIFIIVILVCAIIGYYIKGRDNEVVESFNSIETKSHYSDIYDGFYSNIYDQLFNSDLKNEYEIYNIKQYAIDNYKHNVKILDLGCGTGQHIKILEKYKYTSIGLDKSYKMLVKAQKLNPSTTFIKGDFHNKNIFKKREFSHILCLFYTLYYSENPEKLFKNCNFWLKPGGFLCLHLVHKDKFDPVLEKSSSLIPFFNPQKHSDKRQTKTSLHFNKFQYVSDWKFKNNNVHFIENFISKQDSTMRQNVHKFVIYKTTAYINMLKRQGFKLTKIINLTPVNHDFNSVYIFKKIYGR